MTAFWPMELTDMQPTNHTTFSRVTDLNELSNTLENVSLNPTPTAPIPSKTQEKKQRRNEKSAGAHRGKHGWRPESKFQKLIHKRRVDNVPPFAKVSSSE